MPRKILIALIVILVLFYGAALVIKSRIGDIRPALLPQGPHKQPISSNSPQLSSSSNVPFILPGSFKAGVFAANIPNARDLEFSPDGTLLVSLTSQGKVVALPDTNGDGKADEVVEVVSRLDRPHGIAFYQGKLYIAFLTGVNRYAWNEENLSATFEKKIIDIPYNGGHFSRSLVFDKTGKLFVTIGSSCNVCDEKNEWLASVIVTDKDGSNARVFAKGLRNSVFLAMNPGTHELWAADMGRDFLGDDLPPEEINIIREGTNYGWPICYGNKVHDTNFDKNVYIRNPCEDTVAPIYEFQAHSAPLGITFIQSAQFPPQWQGDLLVAYHGSWNRSIPTGFKVVRMDVEGNTVKGEEDFITGFLDGSTASGRPVDLVFDSQGSLFLSDDKAGAVYKIIHE